MLKNEKGQAVAPKTVTMTKKDFEIPVFIG